MEFMLMPLQTLHALHYRSPKVKPSIFVLSSRPRLILTLTPSVQFMQQQDDDGDGATMENSVEEAPTRDVAVSVVAATEPSTMTVREGVAAEEDGGGKSLASPSMENERQIPVDPVSLRHLGMVADPDSPLSLPSVLTEVVAQSSPLLPPVRRPTFVGASLQCSAASSPVHGAASKRDDHHHGGTGITPAAAAALSSLARQHSVALAHYVASPTTAGPVLSRNASRAEGRSMVPHDEPVETAEDTAAEDSFKCGALCMFIPGFSKKKPSSPSAAAVVSSIHRQHSGLRRRSSVSRVASLERFECGSWSPPPPPSAPMQVVTARDVDVAMEVAKCNYTDDRDAPVRMAFVFDGEPEPRGILKKSASASQRQQESAPRTSSASQRHVRFSAAALAASCPSSPCITPRLAKARAEFNALLEAQSA